MNVLGLQAMLEKVQQPAGADTVPCSPAAAQYVMHWCTWLVRKATPQQANPKPNKASRHGRAAPKPGLVWLSTSG